MRTLDALRKARKEEIEIPHEDGEPEADTPAEAAAALHPESASQGSHSVCPATQKAPNKANFASQQVADLQWVTYKTADLDGPEQSQSGAALASGQPAAASGDGAAGIAEPAISDPESEKALNKANFDSQQDSGLQGVKSDAADLEGPEQSQFGEAAAREIGVAGSQRPVEVECPSSQNPPAGMQNPKTARPWPVLLAALLAT
jgi:hypothetical protein